MGNVLRVFWRDVKRLAKTPAAWLVVIFLSFLPSLYTWFNVAGFWNPYENTGNLRVCIVNNDEGTQTDELGSLDLGSQIVEALKGNDQLGWAFIGQEEAEEEVRSGSAYAAFVIPADFSANVATVLSGDLHQPQIKYYVNEKAGPVAPKITDAGANALDATINETFVSVASETVATIIDEKLDEADKAVDRAKANASSSMDKVRSSVAEAHGAISRLSGEMRDAQGDISRAREGLVQSKDQLDRIAADMGLVGSLAGDANTSLIRFSTNADSTLDSASRHVTQISARTSAAVAKDANAVLAAKGSVDGAIARGQAAAQEVDFIVALLNGVKVKVTGKAEAATVDDALARLAGASDRAKANLDGLQALSNDTAAAASSISNTTGAADTAVQQTSDGADQLRSTLNDSIVPDISDMLVDAVSASNQLSAGIAAQKPLVDHVVTALDELSRTLDTTAQALDRTGEKLGSLEEDVQTLETDLGGLNASNSLAGMLGVDRIDPESVAEFMMSPTTLTTEELYPLNAYGSAMAPLFINLTLWIGVFMLMVIIRLEVDDEGLKRLTIAQRFLGRYLLLSVIACAQAAICCAGCIALGVQTANVAVFYVTAIVASLAYLSIQYALSTTLQHVGKAICIILVFVQIPGATGLYPIEMTPDFFRFVYPLFPFTYGINAMREAISGFYGSQWLWFMGVLVAFQVAFILIGTLVRPYLSNLNRLFAREIEESDIIIGESVELPARRWRVSQVIRALSDRDEFRTELEQRVNRFMRLYPQMKLSALVVGVAVPLVSSAALLAFGAERVIVLTWWLVWLAVVIAFLIAVEFIRDNLSHQLSLESMGADEVRTLFGSSDRFTRVKPLARDVASDNVGDAAGSARAGGGAGAEDGVEAGAGAEAGVGAQIGMASETGAGAEAETEVEHEGEVEAGTEVEAQAGAEPETGAEPEPEPEPDMEEARP